MAALRRVEPSQREALTRAAAVVPRSSWIAANTAGPRGTARTECSI